MADKLRTATLLEALQTRYIGTGHADTTRQDFVSNILRDSYASYIGHPPLLGYMGVGLGECRERVRVRCLEGMVRAGAQGKGEGGGGIEGGEGDLRIREDEEEEEAEK